MSEAEAFVMNLLSVREQGSKETNNSHLYVDGLLYSSIM